MDTPGVLRREEDERNAMEGLTLASAPDLVIAPLPYAQHGVPPPASARLLPAPSTALPLTLPPERPPESPRPNPSPGRLPLLR